MTAGQDLPSSTRALVALGPDRETVHPSNTVPRPATFLAHLLANARALPQARQRRRADAAEVIAAYQQTVQRIRNLNLVDPV